MFSRCNAYPHPCSNKTMLSGAKHTPIHCTSNTKINLTFQKFLAVCHLILFRNDSRRSWTSPNLRDHTCLTWMSIRHLSGSIFYILLFFINPHPPSILFTFCSPLHTQTSLFVEFHSTFSLRLKSCRENLQSCSLWDFNFKKFTKKVLRHSQNITRREF